MQRDRERGRQSKNTNKNTNQATVSSAQTHKTCHGQFSVPPSTCHAPFARLVCPIWAWLRKFRSYKSQSFGVCKSYQFVIHKQKQSPSKQSKMFKFVSSSRTEKETEKRELINSISSKGIFVFKIRKKFRVLIKSFWVPELVLKQNFLGSAGSGSRN